MKYINNFSEISYDFLSDVLLKFLTPLKASRRPPKPKPLVCSAEQVTTSACLTDQHVPMATLGYCSVTLLNATGPNLPPPCSAF